MNLKEILDEMPIEDLQDKEACYHCLLNGMDISDALHDPQDMHGGPITSDRKCQHCYITEEEFGRTRFTKQQKTEADKILEEYEKYKEEKLDR